MATDPVKLPPGFTLDAPQTAVQPPPGFKLDAPAAPSPIAHGASEFWNQVNPIAGIKGLAQMVAHPIDTLSADSGARQQIWRDAAGAFKGGDYVTAIRKGVAGAIPLLGPQMDRSGDQFQSGDVAGGIGSTAGIAANLLAPEVLKDFSLPSLPASTEKAAGKLYQSALKPRTTLGTARTAKAVNAGLENGIPVSPAGVEKLAGVIDDLNGKIGDTIQQAGPDRTISPRRALGNVDELRGRFAEQVNPTADLSAIDAARKDFTDQLDVGGPDYYHGTPKGRGKIIEEQGFDPSRFGERDRGPLAEPDYKGVYLTSDAQKAGSYYSTSAPNPTNDVLGGGDVVRARVDESRLVPPAEWRQLGRQALIDTLDENGNNAPKQVVLDAQVRLAKERGYSGVTTRGGEETIIFDAADAHPVVNGTATRNMSASEAQAMKVGTYRQLKGRAYGELKSASVEAQKALARGLKDAIAEAFPEVADANGKLGDALELEPLLDKAATRIANHNVLGIGAPLAASAAKAATGSGAIAAAAGAIKYAIGIPAIKSRLAIALYKGSKGELTIPMARARVQGYVNSLGEGAEAVTNSQPTYPKAAEGQQQDAPAMNTAMEMPAGQLSRAANGQFVSDKSRLSDFAQP